MGNKNIKKEAKKPKKSVEKTFTTVLSSEPRATIVQPELIKKVKKTK